MNRFVAATALSALLLAFPLASCRSSSSEIEALKKGQQEIQKQLQEIKKLVQARPVAKAAPSGPNVKGKVFDLGSNPVKGAPGAKLTLVEFTDYQ